MLSGRSVQAALADRNASAAHQGNATTGGVDLVEDCAASCQLACHAKYGLWYPKHHWHRPPGTSAFDPGYVFGLW